MSEPSRADVLTLARLAGVAASTGARRDADALARAAERIALECGWTHFERGVDHVLGAPGTEYEEDAEEFVSPEEILHVRGSDGTVEWTLVASPGAAEAESRAWSERGRRLAGVEDAHTFEEVVQAAIAAVTATPERAKLDALADALTLLDHPFSWTLEDDVPARSEDDDAPARWPGAAAFDRITQPLLVLAREATPDLLDVIAVRGIPRGTQLEFAFVQLVERAVAARAEIPASALRALFDRRRTDVLQEAWESSMRALGACAEGQEALVRDLLNETDPLDSSEEHAWIAGVLEACEAEWARQDAKRRSALAEQAGDWETAITYADALAEYPCDDSAATLRALLQRYREKQGWQHTSERGEADLEDALSLAEGKLLRFEGITIPVRDAPRRWVAPESPGPAP